jgi:hypothetical protein
MIEVMRQVRNALVWNLNTDLDNIPACEQWSEMLRKNIDALDKVMADAELKWVGLTDEEISEIVRGTHNTGSFVRTIEAKLKEKNT